MSKRCILTFQAQAWVNDYAMNTWEEDFDATEAILSLGKEQALKLRDDDYDSDNLAPAACIDRNGRNPFYVRCEEAIRDFFEE